MSTVLDKTAQQSTVEHPVTTQYQTEDGQPNIALLEDRTPEAFKASSSTALLVGVLGVMFVLLNYFPLWHSDLWGHLSYGRWIWTQGELPSTEPLMPLSAGVPVVDTAWLSQLLGFVTIEQFGTPGIQFLYALSIITVAASLAFSLYLRTGQPWIALLSVFMFYWCDYQQLLIVRPQLAGMVCFFSVFVMATAFRWRTLYLYAIPVIFVLWANLHGSFVVGLGLLLALTVGRAFDVLLRTKSFKMMLAESRTRQLFFVTELSAAAVLLNPYGIAVYPEVFAISSNANLSSLIEWDPLTLRMKQGQASAVLGLLLMVLYRLSPRRVTTGEVLLLIGLGMGALWTSRLIVWWAPVAAYYFGMHASAVWRRWMEARPAEPKRGGLYTVSLLGMLWIFFAYTPLGGVALRGKPVEAAEAQQAFQRSVSRTTPLEAMTFFEKNPPQGLIFNSYEWGDYLLWAGEKEIKVFVASHVHLVPEEVWKDYLEIAHASSSWKMKLDRYGVNTVVLNRGQHQALADRIGDEKQIWNKAFESNRTVIFQRKKPI